jgi:hypothetical protein
MLVGHLLLALLVGTAAGTLEPRPGGDGESLNLSGCAPATTATLVVDPSSSTTQTSSAPTLYTTLEAALAAARQLPHPRNATITIAASAAPTRTAALRLRRGVVLTEQDSCLRILGAGSPPADSSTAGPSSDHIRMDKPVPASALRKVGPDNKRVHTSARGRIFSFDLDAVNATHAAAWPEHFTQGDPSTRTLGLFYKGRRLEFARSPKAGEKIVPPTGCTKGCENKGSCTGGIPMRAALAGTSKGWLEKHDHKTPSEFAVYHSEVPRVAGWASAVAHGLYLLGNWRVDFVVSGARVESLNLADPINATVRFNTTIPNGLGWKYEKSETGCGCEPFHALNALELITEPLEYALDTVDKAIYIYLPQDAEEEQDKVGELLTVVDVETPILTVGNGAHDVIIENLRVGFSYGGGIVVEDGATNVQLRGCTIHDIGGDAIELRARDVAVRSNDVYNTGGGGIIVSVNDDDAYKTLRPSHVSIWNNHLHHIGYLGMAFGVGISLVNGTTGAHVSHNLIHHVSGKGVHGGHRTSSGVRYANQGQFDNVIDFNEIFQVGLNGSGFAAMYSCCGPVDAAGTVYRYNFVHSSPAVNAIGWDNQLSGQRGHGNVVYFTQNGFGLNHGSFNSMTNNLIVANAPKGGITSFQADAAISTACRGFSDVYNCSLPAFVPWAAELQHVNITKAGSAWGSRFGWYLRDICSEIATTDGKNQRITGIRSTSNAVVYIDDAFANEGCNVEESQNNTYAPTFQLPRNTTVDPGFADYDNLNLALLPTSPIFEALPDFAPIPFDRIGLEIDQWRAHIPTDAETGRLVLAPGRPGGPPRAVRRRLKSDDDCTSTAAGVDRDITTCLPRGSGRVVAGVALGPHALPSVKVFLKGDDEAILADVAAGTPATEREALVCFASATGGPRSWFHNDGWLTSAPVCRWFGVACNAAGSVVSLTLGDNNLTGRLVPECLQGLQHLEVLVLASGPGLGAHPANMSRLNKTTDFSGSDFPLELPSALPLLRILDLGYTGIGGSLPPGSQLAHWRQLEELRLNGNNLCGPLDPEISALPSLRVLKLQRNPLVVGGFPKMARPMPSLVQLTVGFCGLGGRIDGIDFGRTFPALETLDLDGNQFEGAMPASLENLTRLSKLSINMNDLTGAVPDGLCSLNLRSCHAGSDTKYWGDPYFAASSGYFWMKPMRGNRYACPLPSCFRGNGMCNSTDKSIVALCIPTPNVAPLKSDDDDDLRHAPKGEIHKPHRVGPKIWSNFRPLIGITNQTSGRT